VTDPENDEPNPYSIDITPRGNVSMTALQGLGSLLLVLIQEAQIPHIEHLAQIYVIEDGQMAETIREIEIAAYGSPRDATSSTARAAVLPIVVENTLLCFVILEESVIRSLTPQDYLQWDAIPTVLEELLHVRHFSGLADQFFTSDESIRADVNEPLRAICFKCLTEYMAIRWKAEILTPQFADAPEASMIYGEALGPKLDDAGVRIITLVPGIARQSIPFASGQQEFMRVIQYGIFEPLARERAYRDGNRSGHEAPVLQPDASQSWFYIQHIAPYWESLYDNLRQAFEVFDTSPQETVALLADMQKTLVRFLRHVGVEYTLRENGQPYLTFYDAPALALKATKRQRNRRSRHSALA
jgi:hypothetical protein